MKTVNKNKFICNSKIISKLLTVILELLQPQTLFAIFYQRHQSNKRHLRHFENNIIASSSQISH